TRRARPHHLLVDDRLAHQVRALAAVLAGTAHREVAGLPHLPLPRLRLCDAARVAPFHGPLLAALLRDVRREPAADGLLERALLGCVREIHGPFASTSAAAQARSRAPVAAQRKSVAA